MKLLYWFFMCSDHVKIHHWTRLSLYLCCSLATRGFQNMNPESLVGSSALTICCIGFRMWCAFQRTVGTLVDAYVRHIASESSLVELGRVSFDTLGKSHSLQVNHTPNVHTPISHMLTPPMSFSSWWCHPWSSCAGCGSALDQERRRVVSRPHPQLTGTLL